MSKNKYDLVVPNTLSMVFVSMSLLLHSLINTLFLDIQKALSSTFKHMHAGTRKENLSLLFGNDDCHLFTQVLNLKQLTNKHTT